MKKGTLLVVVFLVGVATLFGSNQQKIYSLDSDIYLAITTLYLSSGYALPSTAGPWSGDELSQMVEKIDRDALAPGGQRTYDFVVAELSSNTKAVRFGLDVALEGYYHTDTTNFTAETDWIRGYDERKPVLDIILETWPSKHFYGFSSFAAQGTQFNDYNGDVGAVSYFFGQDAIASNLFFLAPGDIGDLDLGMPFRAFGAAGGSGWSVQVGRDKLSWGAGESGNFMLGDHLKYHNMGRLTAYGKNFKYTLVTSFFPHPDQYYPILSDYPFLDVNGNPSKEPADSGRPNPDFNRVFNNRSNQWQTITGLNMFLGHRLEWRMFADKVGIALSESMMYQSRDNTFDLRVLNPSMIYHSYYIRSHSNSLLAFEADYSPIKHLNLYGQIAIDEFALPGEPVPGKDSWALPSAYGFMAGAKSSYPLGKGMLYGSFEWAKTDPYLYLRDEDGYEQKDGESGINYVVAIRDYYDGGVIYDEDFLGYRHGPDAMVFNVNVGYRVFNSWNVEGNFFYMLHGTHDKWTQWSPVTDGSNPTLPDYVSSPTTTHETGNNGAPNYDASDRDAVSKTLALGLKGAYTILPGLEVYAQGDFVNIVNPGNISSNAPIKDFQLTFGLSYSL